MITAVYDTNILISGIFWRGVPRQLIRLAREGQVQVVTCQALLDELLSVLTRTDKPFGLSRKEATRIANDVLTYVHLVTPSRTVNACRDSKDNIVLSCALAGQAEFIATGDPDLLVLKEFEGIRIVKAHDLLSCIQTQ